MITYEVTVTKDSIVWMLTGRIHREDGPAVEYADGSKYWFRRGARHREDGPAAIYSDGSKEWWVNDYRHRNDGPAVEYTNGTKVWYLDGEELTEAKFNARMNPAKELTVAEIEALLGYSVKVVK